MDRKPYIEWTRSPASAHTCAILWLPDSWMVAHRRPRLALLWWLVRLWWQAGRK